MVKYLLLVVFFLSPLSGMQVVDKDFYYCKDKVELYHDGGLFFVVDKEGMHMVRKWFVDKMVRDLSTEELNIFLGKVCEIKEMGEWSRMVTYKTKPKDLPVRDIDEFNPDNVRRLDGYMHIIKASDGEYAIRAAQRIVGGGGGIGETIVGTLILTGAKLWVNRASFSHRRKAKRAKKKMLVMIKDEWGRHAAGMANVVAGEAEDFANKMLHDHGAVMVERYLEGMRIGDLGDFDLTIREQVRQRLDEDRAAYNRSTGISTPAKRKKMPNGDLQVTVSMEEVLMEMAREAREARYKVPEVDAMDVAPTFKEKLNIESLLQDEDAGVELVNVASGLRDYMVEHESEYSKRLATDPGFHEYLKEYLEKVEASKPGETVDFSYYSPAPLQDAIDASDASVNFTNSGDNLNITTGVGSGDAQIGISVDGKKLRDPDVPLMDAIGIVFSLVFD